MVVTVRSPANRYVPVLAFLGLLLICDPAAAQLNNEYLSRNPDQSDTTAIWPYRHSAFRQIIPLNGVWSCYTKDPDRGEDVRVPGAYVAQEKRIFEREFAVDSSFARKAFEFVALGINYRCEVFVNGNYIGKHVGGHLPLRMRIPREHLSAGQNRIRIEVSNKLHPKNSLPLQHHPGIAYNFGGIFRDVYIVAYPGIHIAEAKAVPELADSLALARLMTKVTIRTDSQPSAADSDSLRLELRIALIDSATGRNVAARRVRSVIAPNSNASELHDMTVPNPVLWHPQGPHLYQLRIILAKEGQPVDEVILPVGFRRLSLSKGALYLNGTAFTLRGVNRYEHSAYVSPGSSTVDLEREFGLLEELGANAVRVVGTPPDPFFLDLCQRTGLLVLVDTPAIFVPAVRFSGPKFQSTWQEYLRDLFDYVSGYPCVVAVGLGTDLPPDPVHDFAASNLIKDLKRETGLLAYLIARRKPPFSVRDEIDFWLLEKHNYLETATEPPATVDVPTILSLSAVAEPFSNIQNAADGHAISRDPLEDRQAYLLGRMLRQARQQARSSGFFVGSLSDWPLSRPSMRQGTTSAPFMSRSGLISGAQSKRLAFEVVQRVYLHDEERLVPEQERVAAFPVIYPILGIGLILVFLFHYKRDKRFQEYIRRVFRYPHSFYMELKDNRKIGVGYTIFLSVVICLVISIMLSSIFYRLRQSPVFDEVLDLLILSDGIKVQLIQLTWQPALFIVVTFVLIYLGFIGLVALLRLISFILAQNLPTRQFYATVFWVFANLVWLLPLVPIYYRVITRPGWFFPAVGIFGLFFLWSAVRLFRGLRVIYMLNFIKMVVLILVVLVVFLGTLGWYYDDRAALFDYLPAYWRLVS